MSKTPVSFPAFIVSSYSSLALQQALFASVVKVPVISNMASANALSDKSTFPTFTRLCPNNAAMGKALSLIVLKYQWRQIAIIGTDDPYCLDLLAGVRASANVNNVVVMTHASFPPAYLSDPAQKKYIEIALAALSQVKAKIIVSCTASIGDFDTMLELADVAGLVSSKHVWITGDGVGSQMLNSRPRLSQGLFSVEPLVEDTANLRLLKENWAALLVADSKRLLDWTQVNADVALMYDSVLVAAAAAARVNQASSSSSSSSWNATALAAVLANIRSPLSTLPYISGNVTFDSSGDRRGKFNVFNRFLTSDGTVKIRLLGVATDADISSSGANAIFYSGTEVPPIDGIPPVSFEEMSSTTFWGLTAFSIFLAIVSLACMVFFIVNRNHIVLKKSAVPFMIISCMGGVCSAGFTVAILFPASYASCTASAFLGNIGFLLILAPLMLKTYR
jgi:ABC-type branched-subunit amino acid transport system substrate-binding protein